jgi:hypothetical protein
LEEDAYIGRGGDGAALVYTKAGRMAWRVYTMCSEIFRAFIKLYFLLHIVHL